MMIMRTLQSYNMTDINKIENDDYNLKYFDDIVFFVSHRYYMDNMYYLCKTK
jgi:hypothetical protein